MINLVIRNGLIVTPDGIVNAAVALEESVREEDVATALARGAEFLFALERRYE